MTPFIPEIAAKAMIPRDLLSQASALHLCIHVHPRWVAVAIADTSGGKIAWSSQFDIEQAHVDAWEDAADFIRARNWSEKVFRKCSLTFDTADFTLVPAAFFQKGKEKDLLDFQTGRSADHAESILISEFNAELIYNVPPRVQSLQSRFPNLRIFPAAYLVARYAMMNSSRDEKFIHTWRAPGLVILCIIISRQMHLLNQYDAASDEDVLYYTANAAMRTGLDLEHVNICLYEHTPGAELEKLMVQYNRNTRIMRTENNPEIPVILQMHFTCV